MKIAKIAGDIPTALRYRHQMKLFIANIASIATLRMVLLAAVGMLTKAEPIFLAGTCGIAGTSLM